MNTHLVMGDFRGALQQCLHIVSSYEHIYAANHPMIGMHVSLRVPDSNGRKVVGNTCVYPWAGLQLFTLGDLCENLGAMKAAQEWHRCGC